MIAGKESEIVCTVIDLLVPTKYTVFQGWHYVTVDSAVAKYGQIGLFDKYAVIEGCSLLLVTEKTAQRGDKVIVVIARSMYM